MAQRLKRLPLMQETQVRSLGWEDPLEKEMVTHASILAWRIPWTEKPGGLQSTGSQRVGHDWAPSPSPSGVHRCACMFSLVWLFLSPWTGACQAPLSMEFSRQEDQSGLPFPTPVVSVSWFKFLPLALPFLISPPTLHQVTSKQQILPHYSSQTLQCLHIS